MDQIKIYVTVVRGSVLREGVFHIQGKMPSPKVIWNTF